MNESVCPSCGAPVGVKGIPKIGAHVTCKSCDTEIEIVWLDPLEFDFPIDEFEDEVDDELNSSLEEEEEEAEEEGGE